MLLIGANVGNKANLTVLDRLLPVSSAARVHDGIFPAPQASLHELAGSVGPRSVPRQLAVPSALQHKGLEQVSSCFEWCEIK